MIAWGLTPSPDTELRSNGREKWGQTPGEMAAEMGRRIGAGPRVYMDTENEIERLQAQLVELQTQVAFQEDAIAGLNEALALQQQDLDSLKRHWELLKQQYSELQQQVPGVEVTSEKPPHY